MVTYTSPSHCTEVVQDILFELQSQALAVESRRKYASTWQQWASWCHDHGFSPWLSGSSHQDSDQLVQFAILCWTPGNGRQRNSASAILSKIDPIGWYHRRFCGFSVGLHAGHQLTQQGMQRMPTPLSRKLPMSPSLLRHFRSRCNFDQAHGCVLWGAAVMGYSYMFRRSEYLSDRGVTKPYAIQLQDVTFRTARGDRALTKGYAQSVSIRFSGSKTDQEGVGAIRTLERSGLRWLFPVRAVWELAQHGRRIGLQEQALLCSTSRDVTISASEMTAAITAATCEAGENPNN